MSKIYVKDWFFVFIVILPLLQACATIKKDKIEVIDNKPRVSKVLKETSLSKFLKRKVAIARFSNETKYGQSILVDENKDIIGKQAMDILSAKLTATDKFILFERADIEKINKELKIGNLESLNIAADYLIVGSISEADYDLELNDKAISAAISKLVNNIVENLLDKPWRSYILSYENGNYLISGGKSQGIEKDDVFGVYKRGAKVKNSSRCKRIL
ncbi:hypothetical protein HZA55_03395 [Candidatus Poribacteria bacterium]|nr:hypothetical protein [Candidatus Poribacteria bacterium]